MRHERRRSGLRLAAAAALALCALAFPALAASDSTDPTPATDALQSLPSVVQASSNAATTSDADSAIVAQVNGATVDVPKDPTAGVTLTPNDAPPLNVSVPGADQASNATTVDNGIVLYQNTGPSADVAVQVVPSSVLAAVPDAAADPTPPPTDPQPGSSPAGPAADPAPPSAPDATPADPAAPTDGSGVHLFSAKDDAPSSSSDAPGGVRMMTILQGPDSPVDYTFQLSVPGGGQVNETGDGGYLVVDSTGNSVAAVLAPWGRDANGNDVPVTYTLNGSALTMHVDTTGAAFPIVADPAVLASTPAKKPAPAAPATPAAPAAPKPDLQCTGFAAPWGGASNGCSVSAALACPYGPCTVSEALTIYVDCHHCATGSLASKLAGIVKNAALWKADGQCGNNCTEGAAREVRGQKWVVVTTWTYRPVQKCSYVWQTVGLLRVWKQSCGIGTEKVLETKYVQVPSILHTCALRAAFSPAIQVPTGGDDVRYLIGATYSLSCRDTGGTARVSLEARDSLTRLFFGG